MNDRVQVIEYEASYEIINLNMFNKDKQTYDMSIIVLYTMEIQKGFIVKKIYKPTKKGIKVKYKIIESKEELREYLKEVNKLIEEYNKNYACYFSEIDIDKMEFIND